jgi:hypothetical protein
MTVLLISGSMGSGKTTVMGEASDVLRDMSIPHAAIDLDAVSVHLLPDSTTKDIDVRNAAALYTNCVAAGVDKILIAAAIEDAQALGALTRACSGASLVVCRLTASHETMAARLRVREPGMRQAEFVERSRTLEQRLTDAGLEDFRVSNDGRDVTAVAREVLERAGWA